MKINVTKLTELLKDENPTRDFIYEATSAYLNGTKTVAQKRLLIDLGVLESTKDQILKS